MIKPITFALGQLVATPTVMAFADEHGVDLEALLRRHAAGDWGDVDRHDASENNAALVLGERILSAYKTPHGRVWIITEGDRSATTILLPSDY
jgi:hypothetical protein